LPAGDEEAAQARLVEHYDMTLDMTLDVILRAGLRDEPSHGVGEQAG
jgi:hypothetical protein